MSLIDSNWILDHWKEILLTLLFVREFLNNLLVRIPSLKSNTIFECFYNTLDALIATIKSTLTKSTKEIPADENTASDTALTPGD